MKAMILVTIVQFLFVLNLVSQSIKTEYSNFEGDYLILSKDYAEFRFGSIFGGGLINIINEKNHFEIINDLSYTGRSKSYILESDYNQDFNSGVIRFRLLTENHAPVPSSEFIIYAWKSKRTSVWSEFTKDGIGELHLQKIPIDSMIYIEANNYYPLKIQLADLISKTYTIVLVKSNGNLLYSKDEYSKIICERINNDSLRCQISQRWHKRKLKHFESILYKETD